MNLRSKLLAHSAGTSVGTLVAGRIARRPVQTNRVTTPELIDKALILSPAVEVRAKSLTRAEIT